MRFFVCERRGKLAGWLVALALFLSASPLRAERPQWVEIVAEHREELRETVRRDHDDPAVIDKLLAGDLSLKERERLFDLVTRGGYVVEDPMTVRLLVAGLDDPAPQISEYAYRVLCGVYRVELLAPHAAEIKAKTQRRGVTRSAWLLAMLPLTSEERAALLSDPRVGKIVRARLGDSEAETAIIQDFHREREFGRKAGLAYNLSYIGTRKAGEALVRDLKSDIVRGGIENVSIRVPIIYALQGMHPDDPMFTGENWRTFRILERIGDHKAAESRAYLDRLYDWARQTYGVEPEGPEGDVLLGAVSGVP